MSIKDLLKKQIEKQTIIGTIIKTLHERKLLSDYYKNPLSIKSIHIQFTNYCNLNCEFCSFTNTQNKQEIGEFLLTKLFDEIMNGKYDIKELNLWLAGEPLLHPKLKEILELIKSYKDKYTNFPRVKIFTNAMVMNESMSKLLINSGAIDWIGFSIDGGNRENCEKIRAGSKFDVIKKNINDFISLNKNIETQINCVIPLDKSLDESWMSSEFKELLELVDSYKINYPQTIGLNVDYPKGFRFMKWDERICPALLNGIAVVQNGNVLPCCNDFNNIHVLGNLFDSSLKEILKGEGRKKMIEDLLKEKKDSIDICSSCNRFKIPYKITQNRLTNKIK